LEALGTAAGIALRRAAACIRKEIFDEPLHTTSNETHIKQQYSSLESKRNAIEGTDPQSNEHTTSHQARGVAR